MASAGRSSFIQEDLIKMGLSVSAGLSGYQLYILWTIICHLISLNTNSNNCEILTDADIFRAVFEDYLYHGSFMS